MIHQSRRRVLRTLTGLGGIAIAGGGSRLARARTASANRTVDTANGANWPQYQHDPANTGTANTTGPKEEVDVAWKFETGGALKAQPAVVDGTVYVTSTDSNVYAVSASSGDEQWSVGTNQGLVSTPAVGNGIVFVATRAGRVLALSAGTGSGQWVFSRDDRVFTPTLYGGSLFVSEDNWPYTVYSLSASSGDVRWKVDLDDDDFEVRALFSPAVWDDDLYIQSSNDGELLSVNTNDGSTNWKVSIGRYPTFSSAAVSDGNVYLGNDNRSAVTALNTNDGSENWKLTAVEDVVESPAIARGTLYVTTNANRLHAIDPTVGTKKWTAELSGNPTTPVVVDGAVYVGSADNKVYAFDTTDGSQLWSFATGNSVVAAPVVLDSVVYAPSTDGYLYALKKKTEIGPGDVTGNGKPPTDPDGDGLYEDVNGDGSFTILDVQALYANLGSEEVQNNVERFDFNGDGKVDLNDVQALYDELTE